MEYTCHICNHKSSHVVGFSNHLRLRHHYLPELFYLEQLKLPKGKCEHCNSEVGFRSIKYGYKRHCSHECSSKNVNVKINKLTKTKEALFNKYGVTNPSNIVGNTQKVKRTKLERYGDENYNNSKLNVANNKKNHDGVFSTAHPEVIKKRKKKMLSTIGVEHHTQLQSFKKNRIKDTLEKYGVEHNLQRPDIRKRIVETNEMKYGGTLHGSELMSKRIKKTMMERYGVEYGQQSEFIKKKIQATNLERYGTISTLQNPKILMEKFGVTNINQLRWVVDKQIKSRLNTLTERYGVTNSYQIPNIKKIIKIKYGVDSVLMLKEYRDKCIASMLKRYGVRNPMQVPLFFNKMLNSQRGIYRLRKIELNGSYITYQSKLELKFINFCIQNNIEIYNGDVINYVGMDMNTHNYYVDFKIMIDGRYRLIEIKGRHIWHTKSIKNGSFNLKCEAAIKYSADNGYDEFKVIFPIDLDRIIYDYNLTSQLNW